MNMNKKTLFIALLSLGLITSCNTIQPSITTSSNENSSIASSEDSSSLLSTFSEITEDYLIYHLEFNNDNYGLNTGHSKYRDADVNGREKMSIFETDMHQGLKFEGGGRHESYLSLPSDVLDNKYLTISYWTYVPLSIANKSCEFSFSNTNKYFYSKSFDKDTWWAYNISTNFNGNNECLTCPSADSSAWGHTSTEGVIEPIFNAWAHMSYVFTPNSFTLIKNGVEVLNKGGDYDLSTKGFEKFYLGTSSFGEEYDFNGAIADFRIYSKALSADEVIAEYDLTSDKFLTTSFDFDDDKESVRNLGSTLNGNAKITSFEDRNVLALDGSANPTRTSLELDNYVLHGHEQITISTDVYIKNTGNRYQRIFEFSVGGQRYLSLYVGFSNVNDLKLEFTNYANSYRDILLDSDYVVPTEKWINITFTSDGNRGTLFVDGNIIFISDDFKYDDDTFWYYPDVHCSLGKTDFYNDLPFTGFYDNFKIYACALTQKEVMKQQGIITIDDDEEAVKMAYNNFNIVYNGGVKIDLPSYLEEGVSVTYSSSDENVVGVSGYVYKDTERHEVTLTASLSRGDYKMNKEFKLTIEPQQNVTTLVNDTALSDTSFEENSLYEDLMLSNIDYMFSLDMDRLLYNYRRIAGKSTLGSSSYPAWISPTSNGAGQFESMYVGALARYTLSLPNYVGKDGSTPLSRVDYMIKEMRLCQEEYARRNPQEKGYFGAIDIKCFKVIRTGGTALGDGTYSWVPYYMLHKNLAMALDVYIYVDDPSIKQTAKNILVDACDWVYNETQSMSSTERNNVLNFEFGGMTEVLYQTYALTKNTNYIKAAHFFEQESLLNSLYNNKNVLPHIHANTAIPKILGCAAAYEATGDEYYKTIVINFYKMVQKMDYANGGLGINEFFEDECVTTLGNYSEETCCSYNMLKLANYIYRWSLDSQVMDYFENIFYNHIMCSMDPATGGKTYPVSTAFGYYKVYSSAENSFWCCCCTGQESFAKLTYGEYYLLNNSDVPSLMVNLFNPMSIKINGDITVIQTGDIFADSKTRLTIKGASKLTINLRVPKWCQSPTLSINGKEENYQVQDGYISITRDFKDGDYIDYGFEMSYRLELQKGSDKSYALFIGPFMLVCDLGNDDVHDIQNDQSAFGTPYSGDKVDYVTFSDHDIAKHINKTYRDGLTRFVMTANNQELEFIRFMDCYHQRYGMYLYYYFDGENPSDEYLIEGNRVDYGINNINQFNVYRTNSNASVNVTDGALNISNGAEVKAMISDIDLGNEFEVGATFKASSPNSNMNSGVYLFATQVASGQDLINSLNVQIERNASSSSATIKVHQFAQRYMGVYNSAQGNVKVNEDGTVSLRIIVKNGYLFVLANGSASPIIKTKIDENNYQGGQFGIRSQFASVSVTDIYYIKK